MEFLLWAVLFAGLGVLYVVLSKAILVPSLLQEAARSLWQRYPRTAEKLGLGRQVGEAERLHDRAGVLVGRLAVVEEAIVGGRGRLTIDGISWSVQGPDLPAGTRVKITKAEGTVLSVSAV